MVPSAAMSIFSAAGCAGRPCNTTRLPTLARSSLCGLDGTTAALGLCRGTLSIGGSTSNAVAGAAVREFGGGKEGSGRGVCACLCTHVCVCVCVSRT
jgi:hypothetical protein